MIWFSNMNVKLKENRGDGVENSCYLENLI